MKKTLIAIALGLGLLSVAADTNSPPPANAQSQIQPSSPEANPSEIALLKQEVQLQQNFQDNLLKVVVYSLGTVGAIALLLVGYNWWSANKIYDRDKNALKEEILNAQKQAHLAFEGKITASVNSSLAAINENNQKMAKDILINLEKFNVGLTTAEEKYLQFSRGLSEKINIGLTTAEEKYLKLRDETGNTLQTFRADLDNQLRSFIKTSVTDLESRLSQQIQETNENRVAEITKLRSDLYSEVPPTEWTRGGEHEKEKPPCPRKPNRTARPTTLSSRNKPCSWSSPAAGR